MKSKTSNYTLLNNPIINELIAILRDLNTSPSEFRPTIEKLGEFCAYEIAKDLDTINCATKTPLFEKHGKDGIATTEIINHESIALVSLLRAAIPFIQGFSEIFPVAPIAIISASRGKQKGMKFNIETKYSKGLKHLTKKTVIIPDPMLASASTMLYTINIIKKEYKPKNIIICSAIASIFGIEKINKKFKDVKIYTAAIDNKLNKGLNEHGYIVPGLGDAGDRAMGTL